MTFLKFIFVLVCHSLTARAFAGLSIGKAIPGPTTVCAAFAQNFESQFPDPGTTINRAPPGDYVKSRVEFVSDLAIAKDRKPGMFADIAIEPIVYRFDHRTPNQISEAGGFYPNPAKSLGGVYEHTVGSAEGNAGTGSYVSLSWQHTEAILTNEFFMSFTPQRLVINSQVNKRDLGVKDWQSLMEKRWEINTPETSRPVAAIFRLFEYRVNNVEGVRVVGGSSQHENEVIARGVEINDGMEWRVALVKVPIQYVEVDGKLRARPISSKSLHHDTHILAKRKVETTIEYGSWYPLLRVVPPNIRP